MAYYGDIRLGDTIDIHFCTVQSTGAPTTLAGSPVISAYPANSTTQLTAGITLSVDFDSVTGLNNVRVVASSGNGYATATNYDLVITTGTVNSVSAVGYVVGSFSIENRSALMPTTAARTLDVSSGGEAGVDWANVGSPTTTNNLSGTSTKAVEPTVAGRTLDVSATGEAGIDWNNIGSPTTTQNLSGTSTKAVEPTVAGRTLDVSTGGEAGIDWANVGTPSSTVSLSGTTLGHLPGNFKKNTAFSGFEFMMTENVVVTVSATSTVVASPKTGLGSSVTVTRSIDGGAFGAGTLSAVTEVGNGLYSVDFGSGDLNGNNIVFNATATGCNQYACRIVTSI